MGWADTVLRPAVRAVFAQLGEDVQWTPDGGSPTTVRGIFLMPYQELLLGGPAPIAGADPRFVAMSADMPTLAEDDVIVRGGVSYKVKAPEADDPGGYTVMQLQAPDAP